MRPIYGLFILALTLPQLLLAEQNVTFATAKIGWEKLPLIRTFDGVVEAINQATVSAQVSGRVTEIYFDVNDFVQQGEVILRIRDTEYKARLDSARAGLNEAKAGFKDAQLELARIKGLVKDKMVPESDFDKAEAALSTAKARVAASESRIKEVQEQVDNTVIRAPFSGVVVQRHVQIGEATQMGQALMTGFSLDALRVNVDIPQAFINAVRKYQQAMVNIPGDVERQVPVKGLTIFPYANPTSHTFRVRAELPEKLVELLPGMLVKINFTVDETERLLIPNNAIVRRSEVIGSYVLDEKNQITLRQIRLGHEFDGKTEVLAGLDAGETVALDPVRAGVILKQQAETK